MIVRKQPQENHFEAYCYTKVGRQKGNPEDEAENSAMAVLNNVAFSLVKTVNFVTVKSFV